MEKWDKEKLKKIKGAKIINKSIDEIVDHEDLFLEEERETEANGNDDSHSSHNTEYKK